MQIPLDKVRVGIVGQTGYGKTYLTLQLLKHFKRVVIFDLSDDADYDQFREVYSYHELADVIRYNEKFKVVCRFARLPLDYDIAARMLYDLGHRQFDGARCLLVLDEVSLVCPNSSMADAWADIFQRGRRRNIGLLWNTQRPALVHRTVTALTYDLIALRCDELRDAEYFPRRARLLDYTTFGVGEYKFVKGDSAALGKLLGHEFKERGEVVAEKELARSRE